jgi:hypothetical protein
MRPTITNRLGLPQPIVDAVRADPYSSGRSDISVTTLLKPPRAVALERQHASEIVEDAADRLWALVGQIGHAILERGSKEAITERRLYTEVNGWTVSGQVDLVPPDLLLDYKFTSVWSCKDGLKPEWEQQLNMLHLLCVRNGIHIVKAQIVAIYRDWSTLEARRSPDYPQTQVQLFDVPLWTLPAIEAYMTERVRAHQAARAALPECTAEERWGKPTKWALMKRGRERAVKLFDSAQVANVALEAASKEHYIQERPGEQVRCQNYCAAMPFCSQAKALGVTPEGEP